jgi:hypothetical protein
MKKERRQKAQSSKQQEPELYCLLPSAFSSFIPPLSALIPCLTLPLAAGGNDPFLINHYGAYSVSRNPELSNE